ncbi:MAG: phosphatidylglycerophosphatase A [Alphaproteobacteria bacterium]|nr:phosphatidylglycerophosphatase A [Alphaproteobacteria bacterium]
MPVPPLHTVIATFFGAGRIKPAPGTWGSLAAILPALSIFLLGGERALLLAILAVAFAGYWAADRYEKTTGLHDDKAVVIDEVAGQWIALLPALSFAGLNPLWIFCAFALFRFFDIVKPWPVGAIDRHVKGAAGVMLDDMAAGLISALLIMGLYIYAGSG